MRVTLTASTPEEAISAVIEQLRRMKRSAESSAGMAQTQLAKRHAEAQSNALGQAIAFFMEVEIVSEPTP